MSFDEPSLVPCAGLLPAAALAQRVGLAGLVEERVRLARHGASSGTKALTVIGSMLAGGDSIDDGVETFVSHSSLAVAERRRAETAFAEARDCVIVSTSTLELGIDVGDLDRVIQVGAPTTVASFLQRLGRTGRRSGTVSSMLFLATDEQELLRAAALLLLWGEGYVEPVLPPPTPRHVVGQQLLALCLQEGTVGAQTWPEWLGSLTLASAAEVVEIATWLVDTGHVDSDTDMLFMGPEAERRYGRRHFLELLSLFTADPEFTVLHGRVEIGAVDPMVLTRRVDGPRVILLAGRSWQVSYIDWKRRRTFVEPSADVGTSRWMGMPQPLSYAMTDAIRRLLLGAELPRVTLSKRASARLASAREDAAGTVDPRGNVVASWDSISCAGGPGLEHGRTACSVPR